MAKLHLKFKESMIKEIVLQNRVTTIGRTDINDIQIDNLAVSGNHARIIGDGDTFIIEDLSSTNGTYVNDSRISRQLLLHDSVITIGKHSLVFLDPVGSNSPVKAAQFAAMNTTGRTDKVAVPDQAKQAAMDQTIVVRGVLPTLPSFKTPAADKVGVLTVLNGPDKGTEYLLPVRLATIGKSAEAEIRLKGLFVPKVAALIKRTGDGYFITSSSRWRKLLVNGAPVSKDHQLKPADIVEIASLRAQFSLRNG